MKTKDKKKPGRTFIAKRLQKKSYFIGKDGKAAEVESAVAALRNLRRR
jgi:hypothetical protein